MAKVLCFACSWEDNVKANDDGNDLIFTIKDTKLYVPVVTLSARDSQKLSKLVSKGFERSVCRTKYKTKSENKNMRNKYRYFLKSNSIGVNRICFSLFKLRCRL